MTNVFDDSFVGTFIHIVPIGLIANWAVHDLYTFFHAYLTPQKALLFTINTFGEANFEFVVTIMSMVLVCIWLFYLYKKFLSKESVLNELYSKKLAQICQNI